jgi:two-component system chemotaxis response regulator CheY
LAYKLETLKILVVEDNKPMMDLMKSILKTFGVGTILIAKDGDDAFELYRRENPDLIITDWMMQPCDGISLTRKIRTNKKGPNPYVPIILMTGFSEKRRVISARDSGITEFLVKPFNVRDLYKRMHEIIENPRQFVDSDDFFGPDRRRKATKEYKGPQRRREERSSPPPLRPEDIDFLRE